ncbi:metal ABC transporter permease [Marinococcus sp. PL1-022]|uniref:metal ABC transporter permease n=1 Tax=Marinococcus sp. PL1-022 TaxID=3095363 RepID=UPI0029C4DD33|nr:metal ABC transporter permease [Marinococcus sp. PL1-022]MDX6153308.1 metal ABC transporter permease [Marinococcus sp. PL1-022]
MFDMNFVERSIIAAVLIGLTAPLIGSFLVVRRSSLIADSLAHVTLAGVTAGVLAGNLQAFWDINPLYTGFLFAFAGSLIIERVRHTYGGFQELAAPILMAAAVGLSAVFMSVSADGVTEWYGYLFGSVVSVQMEDLWFIGLMTIAALGLLAAFGRELMFLSFDEEMAAAAGIPVKMLNVLLAVLLAIVISASMQVVGVLLAGALITLPAAAAMQWASGFKRMLLIAVIIGEASVAAGVTGSIFFGIASGGGTVVTAALILFVTLALRTWINWKRNRRLKYERHPSA